MIALIARGRRLRLVHQMTTHQKSSSESFSHYYAKIVLIQWLRAASGRFFSMRWHPFGSRIYAEYPILLVNGQPTHGNYDEPFDEIPSHCCSCPVFYENLLLSSAVNPCEHRFARTDHIPSREEVILFGHKLGAIVDVAIVDGGRLKYIFEIVNTNPCSPMKRRLLLRYAQLFDATVYEVDSDYVMRQVGMPERWRGVKLSEEVKVMKRFRRRWKGKKS